MPLRLETTISLGSVAGRIDHLAIDLARRRLFVAQLGDNTISVVDLEARRVAHVIRGLSEPQGLVYLGLSDLLFVANGGDGSVRVFAGPEYKDVGRIDLGEDADNIRVDMTGTRVFVGYGNGRLVEIEAIDHAKKTDIPLKGHPESFQLDPSTSRAFVNVPGAHEIAVVDTSAGRQIAGWPLAEGGNFAMAIDHARQRVITVFRSRPSLAAFSMRDGTRQASVPTCGDADDVFVDARRRRVYVSCGEGFIDVLQTRDATYERVARIATFPGARTSLFVPDLDRLFVAARATSGHPASILVFRTDESPPMARPAN